MGKQEIKIRTLIEQLKNLGVTENSVLLVYSSYGAIRPVEDGPDGVIKTLLAVLGPGGTLVMPAMTDNDDEPFGPETSFAIGMGIIPETFRKQAGVLRSDNPSSFAARGPRANFITANHPQPWPDHGIGTPVARVYDLDCWVLLSGVDHDADTTIHLAEHLGGVQYKRAKYTTVYRGKKIERINYYEIDHCCQRFKLVNEWLNLKGLQHIGKVGHGIARLIKSKDIVSTVVEQIKLNPTIFLHDYGFDHECDEARDCLKNTNIET